MSIFGSPYVSEETLIAMCAAGASGPPCEICGKPVTEEDIYNGAVGGEGGDLVHKDCWGDRGVLEPKGRPTEPVPFPG